MDVKLTVSSSKRSSALAEKPHYRTLHIIKKSFMHQKFDNYHITNLYLYPTLFKILALELLHYEHL